MKLLCKEVWSAEPSQILVGFASVMPLVQL
jgi:hypothetical protein